MNLWKVGRIPRFAITVNVGLISRKVAGFILRAMKRKHISVNPAPDPPPQTGTGEISMITPNKGITSRTPEESKETQFIQALGIVVRQGFNPLLVYAHAHYETAGFTKLIGNFNYFGMKPPAKLRPPDTPGWDGTIIKRKTHDVINDTETPVEDYFCDFSSATNCLTFYIFQIKRVYPPAYENRENPQAYIYWLAKIGWGQDKDYEKEFLKRYAELKSEGNGIYEYLNRYIQV